MRTNIDINESFVRKAKKLTRLKTKRQIVDKALEFLFVQRAGMAFCDTTAVVFGRGIPKPCGETGFDPGG